MRRVAAARWLLRRAALAALVVVGVTTITFVLIHLAPGDPIYVLAGDGGSASYYDAMRAKYGLDRTIPDQLIRYVRSVMSGDLGYSFMFQRPVLQVLLDHVPATLLLGAAATLLAVVLGFGAALACILPRSRIADAAIRGAASVLYSAPVYWTGQLLILVAAVKLGVLPAGGMTAGRESFDGFRYVADVGRHLILPSFALSLPFAAVIARVARAGMLETLGEPHITAAYARGLGWPRLVLRHVAMNSSIPVVALIGQHAAQLLAGAALTEALFGWPGLGHLVLHAGAHRDYPLVTASFILISGGVVFFNVVTDAAIAWLDPRIRTG